MKKVGLTSLLLVFTVFTLSAQDFKGKVLFAPSFNYSTVSNYSKTGDEKSDGSSYRNFGLALPVGYFVSNRVAIGLAPVYSNYKNEYQMNNAQDDSEWGTKRNSFGISFLTRHYTKLAEKLNFFGEAAVGFGWGNKIERWPSGSSIEPTVEEDEYKETSFVVALRPGLNYSLTKCMSVEATIGSLSFSHTSSKDVENSDDGPTDHSTLFGVSFNTFSFGVLFLF